MTFTTFSEENGIVFGKYHDERGSYLVVADQDFAHYRITLSVSQAGECHVGVDAEWSDAKPGELANFTYSESGSNWCALDEVEIADDGRLTVMGRKKAASHVQFRTGFIVQLSPAFVEPLRKAVAMLREEAGA